jgi:hypothetical protein
MELLELGQIFVHPVLPKHRSYQTFCFQANPLHFLHGGNVLKFGRKDFDCWLGSSMKDNILF